MHSRRASTQLRNDGFLCYPVRTCCNSLGVLPPLCGRDIGRGEEPSTHRKLAKVSMSASLDSLDSGEYNVVGSCAQPRTCAAPPCAKICRESCLGTNGGRGAPNTRIPVSDRRFLVHRQTSGLSRVPAHFLDWVSYLQKGIFWGALKTFRTYSKSMIPKVNSCKVFTHISMSIRKLPFKVLLFSHFQN